MKGLKKRYIILALFIIIYVVNIILKIIFYPVSYEKTRFSEEEIKLIETEFKVHLTDKQKLQKIKYFHLKDAVIQIWIANIENHEKFILYNLNLDIRTFKEISLFPYGKNKELFNDYEEPNQEGLVRGFRGYIDERPDKIHVVEIYQEPRTELYTASIYKRNNFINYDEVMKVFKYTPNKKIWNWKFWIIFWK